MQARIERDGDEYVINGRKWWTSGAASERCKIAIFMGVTDPDADPYRQHSMILVPLDTPGVKIVRTLPVFGYDHAATAATARSLFEDVRVPATNMLGEEGAGFAIAQARLGPGRIHHCMRAIGMAERAFDLMCERAHRRSPFGKPLARQGVVRNWIAESRIEIEQARLLTLKTAWLMDTAGNKGARIEISAIKVAAPEVALRVIDRAIQVHGGGGVSDDFPLAAMYAARAHAADRGRPGRGPQALDRAPRAAPLPAARAAGGGLAARGTLKALVTGGARGIGAAIAARLRADGLEVVTVDRDEGADVRARHRRATRFPISATSTSASRTPRSPTRSRPRTA